MEETLEKKVVIYSIWHNKLFDEMYEELDDYSLSNIVMYGVNEKYEKIYNSNKNYQLLFEYDFPIYNSILQKKNYCQTSCMYHIYLNKLHLNTNYIGFVQYDMKLKHQLVYKIEKNITENPSKTVIYYEMLEHPDKCLTFDNLTEVYLQIINSYNTYFKTNFTFIDFLEKSQLVPLLHTFVISSKMFSKMMEWFISIFDWIETTFKNVEKAQLSERIFGLFLCLEAIQDENIVYEKLETDHIWPMYHDQTVFDFYKVSIPENVA